MSQIVELIEERKGTDIVVLDLRETTNFCDFFILATGRSSTHLRSIADSIIHTLHTPGKQGLRAEGYKEGKWIILDCFDLVVHLFDEQTREFYDLEGLWGGK